MALGAFFGHWEPNSSQFAVDPGSPAPAGVRGNRPILRFTATEDRQGVFLGRAPTDYDGSDGTVVLIQWMAASATSGNTRWEASIDRGQVGASASTDSYSSAVVVTSAAPGTTGHLAEASIAIPQADMDGLLAGETFRLKIRRLGDSDAGDTMSGDAQVIEVAIREGNGS